MIESAVLARLLLSSGVTAIVGVGTAARIYPVILQQKPVLPAITYQRISGSRDMTTDGESGLAFARIQIDCWASESYAAVKGLANEVRKALSGWRGGAAGVTVQLAEIDGDRDGYDPDTRTWRASCDLGVWFEEADE